MSAGSSLKRAPRSAELRIGGLARLSTCDWPGELAATVFCQGCSWSCGYCHNPHLIPPRGESEIAWQGVLSFLDSRRGLLDGVVFSGGEPTLQAALPDAMRAVRGELGFRVGLHTAGPCPTRLSAVLPLVDWIGFDVKAAFDDYERITGVIGSGINAKASLVRLLESGVACDIRTTVHNALLDRSDLARLASDLVALGVPAHRLQPFRAAGCTTASLL
ncbi:anaerobic ribonucleoside-triphosphate reductase activating protein (plasmid) [Bradyrhizobium barranii]|uniref:Anaerobic ribonucleoside-triphosphate reductase activating protein n=1 Tax=Bradyrhizobium barranii TaxID=2992140 RepID=A0ABY3R3D9_9BRAD|nr:anaerobic ribonucleoside-triphosphate reductase activating protein [Bradyrhizobium japonicum]UFW88438.1 anaerobic ribonucleoside-triphosphate reductase activating protein [Bradyrhizobium japonicum]UFW92131.1 anaerobic ribonucleoside-triphosphate reductase activating protein [Bradyrhizobium japonicum]